MRFLYVIRFRDNHNNPKSYQVVAGSPEAAAKKIRSKGARVVSVRRKKK